MCVFFFCKQKTAYEMRISDWMSDVCSSDLRDVEIPRAVSNLRFFAHAATQFSSESHHGQAGLNYTLRQPLGEVATISPWNLPLYLFTWKIAPALAAGNTVVAKPSEITPMTATMLGELAAKIGLPAGGPNILHDNGNTSRRERGGQSV